MKINIVNKKPIQIPTKYRQGNIVENASIRK